MIRVDPAQAAADSTPAAPAAAAPADARALIERQLATLTHLAEMAMRIAEAATLQATGAAPPADGAPAMADPALTFTRVARAVRLTLALQSRLAKDLAALDQAATQARTAKAGARRARLHRLVEQAIEAEHDDDGAVERLSSTAWERLVEAEDDGELEGLSFAEAVARICEDLGLSPDQTLGVMAARGEPAPQGHGAPGAAVPWPGGPPPRDPAPDLRTAPRPGVPPPTPPPD